jgi:predicted transcriptional regulator
MRRATLCSVRTFAEASRVLGKLEERVMEIIWRANRPLPVRDVAAQLRTKPALAYTTVMTTLDRLYKKELLARRKQGNAFLYRAAMTRDEYHQRIVEETVTNLIEKSTMPVLAAFVDAAATIDEKNLARLEELIAAKRRKR